MISGKRIQNRRFSAITAILLLSFFIILSAAGCSKRTDSNSGTGTGTETNLPTADTGTEETDSDTPGSIPGNGSASESPAASSGIMKVHFIDVGQGDAILAESGGQYLLIDAGENTQGDAVCSYLRSLGVSRLDYIICTHPHSDHIGGMDTVISSFDAGIIIMPDVIETTRTFEAVLDAISAKGLTITKAAVGTSYALGSGSFRIIAPNGSGYDDINDYSVGIRLTNGSNSFLLAGDAEALSEREMLESGTSLSADVLKLGHHGSSYSSSDDFLDAVDPSYAVISVGTGNQYGHPSSEILASVSERDIQIFRTDRQGTIIFTSDGNSLTVSTVLGASSTNSSDPSTSSGPVSDSGSAPADASASDAVMAGSEPIDGNVIVHTTKTGKKYHSAGCIYLKSDIAATLDEALARGLEPCSECSPPVKQITN